jgi:hypothetical protein
MATLSQIRKAAYKTQRMIGDYQAATRGPGVLGKRILRRHVTRSIMRPYNRLWKKL